MTKLSLIFLFVFVCVKATSAQRNYPVITQIVTDHANLFSERETLELEEKLTAYEHKTSHQIVVLTIDSLGNDTVENYAVKTFNREGNRFGQAASDNGILILVAYNDRKFRIEVGDGLTPIITDAFASRINRHNITPAFKDGDYYRGINDATSEIIKLIDSPKYRDEFTTIIEQENTFPLWGKMLLGLFISIFLGTFIFLGGRILVEAYKHLISLYKGLITGKVSILIFPVLLLVILISIAIGLPFVIMPLIFIFLIIIEFNSYESSLNPLLVLEETGFVNASTGIILAIISLVFTPLMIAYFTRSKTEYTPINFSLFKNDSNFMSKNFSSGGISSGRSLTSSGSSRSSFSGGGGRSSGGGASGSW